MLHVPGSRQSPRSLERHPSANGRPLEQPQDEVWVAGACGETRLDPLDKPRALVLVCYDDGTAA